MNHPRASSFARLALAVSAAVSPVAAQSMTQAGASACPAAASPDTATRPATPRDTSSPRGTGGGAADDRPAIVLFASASAREVRFARQPRILVRLCGATTDSVHVVERRNLPDPVQPGVTYKDVYIAVEIMGHLDAGCLAQRVARPDAAARGRECSYGTARDSATAATRPTPP